jgi:hypothetical protein
VCAGAWQDVGINKIIGLDMQPDNRFGEWAAAFLRTVSDGGGAADAVQAPSVVTVMPYDGITRAAGDLLRAVDAGGVPAFVTSNLRQVASDNGIETGPGWTPNDIVDAIRAKARAAEPGAPAPGL